MYRTVIIDDYLEVAQTIAEFFPKNLFQIFIETNGAAACQTIARVKPHLVISDVSMAGFNGYEVVRKIRELGLSPVIFMITGFCTIDAKNSYDLDAHLFLRKPVQPTEIVSAALRHLRKANSVPALSKRENEIITLIAQGLTSREIAKDLGISARTVAKHRENMMQRTNSKNTADLIVRCFRSPAASESLN